MLSLSLILVFRLGTVIPDVMSTVLFTKFDLIGMKTLYPVNYTKEVIPISK